MLEVAVIGAGASALVASRHLVGHGMRPFIFESAKSLGGAWGNGRPGLSSGKMWNGLTTNLSKHTCRFSEWPWPDDTPTFPSALDMGRYLDSFAQHFLDPSFFHYQCQVTNVMESSSSSNDAVGYRVEWTDLATSETHAKEFGGVVVASGFFSEPHFPDDLNQNHPAVQSHKLVHACDYESSAKFQDQTVVVVGSSFSGIEIATDVCVTAKRVIHVVSSIPWVIPRYIPCTLEDSRTCILPVDLALYRRTKDAPETPEKLLLTPEMSRQRHEFMDSIVGRRQEKSALGIPRNWDEPPMVAISDYYLDLLIQGDMEVVHGKFQGPSQDGSTSTWSVQSPTGQMILLEGIDTVICATGYETNLDKFLHKNITQTLEYDIKDPFCPISLCWDTLHPKLPNLFFCGMYRGPYMGIMEQQGRLAAEVLSGNIHIDVVSMTEALEQSTKIRKQPTKPQFPHFDYLGFMDTLNKLQSNDFPKVNNRKGDMVGPAFFQSTDEKLIKDESKELQNQVERGVDGSQIPSVVLSAIIGEWNFDRQIVHFSDNRQEHIYGTVKYSRPVLDNVLYREDGFYELSPSKTLNVFREYEYQVAGDCLEIYFVEQEERAHLFLSLKFSKKEGDFWVATSDHLCIKDLYKARFELSLDGLAATYLKVTYRVKGPRKTTNLQPS